MEAARYLLIRAILMDMDNYRPWLNLAAVNVKPANKIDPDEITSQTMDDGGELYNFNVSEFDYVNSHDAKICLRQVLHLCPDHPTAELMLDNWNRITGDSNKEKPTKNELMSALHLGETELGGPASCDSWPEEAYEAAKKSEEFRYNGDLLNALAYYQNALKICPDAEDLYHCISLILSQLDRLDQAIETIEMALSKYPWNRQFRLIYSGFLRRTGHYIKAINEAQQAIMNNPNKVSGWVALARSYLAADKRSQAIDALKQAIKLSPPWSWELLNSSDLFDELGLSGSFIW
jgi:tetratricopeptide (TPR) repeat protein